MTALDVRPLLALPRFAHAIDHDGNPRPVAEIADVAHVTRRTVHRWITAGEIPLDAADRLAANLGVHVGAIFPDYYRQGA